MTANREAVKGKVMYSSSRLVPTGGGLLAGKVPYTSKAAQDVNDFVGDFGPSLCPITPLSPREHFFSAAQ